MEVILTKSENIIDRIDAANARVSEAISMLEDLPLDHRVHSEDLMEEVETAISDLQSVEYALEVIVRPEGS